MKIVTNAQGSFLKSEAGREVPAWVTYLGWVQGRDAQHDHHDAQPHARADVPQV